MWRHVRAGVLIRRRQLTLSVLAVVLGVAFATGTLVLGDSLRAAFSDVFGRLGANQDLLVRGALTFDSGDEFGAQRAELPADTAERVAALPGVADVNPAYDGAAQLLRYGHPFGGQQVSAFGFSAPAVGERAAAALREGRYPARAEEVAIDSATATALGVHIGDSVQVAPRGPVRTARIVGLLEPGYGGTTITMFALDVARELYSATGGPDSLAVLADEGVDLAALRARVAEAVGERYEVATSAQLTAESSADVQAGLAFATRALLAFAAVSVLVGALLIANTFSILLAQRRREVALLRAVGAARRQVLAAVLAEAGVVGAVGAVLGLVAGVGLAIGVRALLDAAGAGLPQGELVVRPRAVVIGAVLGVGVPVLAALPPGLRMLRTPPVAALRAAAAVRPAPPSRVRLATGAVALAVGGPALLVPAVRGEGLPLVAGGALLSLVGLAQLSPVWVGPLLGVLGWPLGIAGLTGRLAQRNARRAPRRTAATAAALAVGVALVGLGLIIGASYRASSQDALDRTLQADLQLRPTGAGAGNLPGAAVDAVAGVEQVEALAPVWSARSGPAGPPPSWRVPTRRACVVWWTCAPTSPRHWGATTS